MCVPWVTEFSLSGMLEFDTFDVHHKHKYSLSLSWVESLPLWPNVNVP